MNKRKSLYQKARKKGYNNFDILKMQQIAKRTAAEVEKESTERAFLYMLAIPLNVLVNDYWPKSAKKRAPKFIEDVIKLYEAVQEGVVSDQELAELLDDMAGVKITAEWMKGKQDGKD